MKDTEQHLTNKPNAVLPGSTQAIQKEASQPPVPSTLANPHLPDRLVLPVRRSPNTLIVVGFLVIAGIFGFLLFNRAGLLGFFQDNNGSANLLPLDRNQPQEKHPENPLLSLLDELPDLKKIDTPDAVWKDRIETIHLIADILTWTSDQKGGGDRAAERARLALPVYDQLQIRMKQLETKMEAFKLSQQESNRFEAKYKEHKDEAMARLLGASFGRGMQAIQELKKANKAKAPAPAP
jgi:hypothetical protein